MQPTNTDASKLEAALVDTQSVNIDVLELTRPRPVAVEHIGLWAMFYGITEWLTAIVGVIIAPSSELAAHRWIGVKTALGEFGLRGVMVLRARLKSRLRTLSCASI